MIKKLDIKNGGVEDLLNCIKKINELVDAVNELQTKVNKMAQNIDFAQPEVKENVQDHRPNMVIDDPFGPHLNIIERLQKELIRTRKALDVAVDALKIIGSGEVIEHSVMFHEDDNKIFIANKALEQITALEQKE